jgi:hypothetical protein
LAAKCQDTSKLSVSAIAAELDSDFDETSENLNEEQSHEGPKNKLEESEIFDLRAFY